MVDDKYARRMDGPTRQVKRPRNVPIRNYPAQGATELLGSASSSAILPNVVPTPRPVQSNLHPWRKRVAIAATGTVFVTVGFMGISAFLASKKIITQNAGSGAPALAGQIDPAKLKGEGDGRINILLMGVGGPGHEAPNLSDTIMVASIDPRTKDVAMLSIPRDFYVKIPGYGSTKINAANSYGETAKNPGGGAALAKQTVSDILDVPIHYYVRVDFAAFKQAIDAVGGIEINVEKAIFDTEYPCDKGAGYCPLRIAAGAQHMNGTLALKYARSRKGTAGGDFDRAARQQTVLIALQKKALELSTLTNPAKILGLVSAAGNHVSTDLQPAEITKMAELIKQVDTTRVATRVLDNTTDGLLQNGNIAGAGSIVIPRAGLYNYTEIRDLVHTIFADSYLKEEAAKVEVQNGTTTDGIAAKVAQILKTYHYNVVSQTTAARKDYPRTVIYDYSNGSKPYTVQYLEKRFKAKAQPINNEVGTDTDNVGAALDVRVIVGNDYLVKKTITP